MFPSYAFLLCAPPARVRDCVAAFAERGLACAQVGVIDATGVLRARSGAAAAVLLRDTGATATGLSSRP